MAKIKLTDKYTLLIPGYFAEDKLISKIKDITGKNIKNRLGLRDSYSISIVDEYGEYYATLEVDIVQNNNIYTTKITQSIESVIEYGKEVCKSKPEILMLLTSEIKGLILVKHFETIDYCTDLKKTRYGVTYEDDSLDNKLLKFCMNELGDATEAMTLYQLIRNNKAELLDILNM